MKCYDCAVNETVSDAVAVCCECGKGLCLKHASVTRVPAYYQVSTGMSPVAHRCCTDRPKILCTECQATSDCCDAHTG